MSPRDAVKEILYNDKDKLVFVLEELGCYKINPHFSKNEIRCSLPDGTNGTSVSVTIEPNIPCFVFSRGSFEDYEIKDIFSLVQFIRGCKFVDALKWLCGILKVPFEDYEPTDTMPIVYELRREKRKRNREETTVSHIILPLTELKKYKKCVVESWVKEGLSPDSQRKYGIMDDVSGKRWLIPIFDEHGNLISIKGRTYAPNWEIIGIPKYLYYYKLGINDILFGLDKNRQKIERIGEIILFESEKSVIAADSYGYDWCANLGTNGINRHLKKKIISLNCSNCVLAFDKDVSWKDVMKEARKLISYMNVYVIYDKQNLLIGKQAPVDAGKEVFDRLYKDKIRVR